MVQTSLSEIDYKNYDKPSGGSAFGGLLDIAGDMDRNSKSGSANDVQLAALSSPSFEAFGSSVRDIIEGGDRATEAKEPINFSKFENRAFDAYSQALADGKHTMVLFSARPCGFCKTMKDNLSSPELAKYSDDFVASVSYRGEDEGGDHLAAAVNVIRYPTMVIFKTDMDKLHVVGRVEGVFKPEEISKVLDEALKEKIERPSPEPSLLA